MTTGPGGPAAPQQARPDPDGDPAVATLPDDSPAAMAASLPAGNVIVLGGPGSGKTTLLEAAMYDLTAPSGTALLITSSRQAAVASTARLLARVQRAAGGALSCVTWHAFARGLVTSHAALLPPSTRNVDPFTYDASSLARNTAAFAISSARAKRPGGMCTSRR